MTYQKAYEKLQAIINELESDELSIDKMKKKVDEAQALIKFCKEKLREIETDLEDSLNKED